MFTHLRHRLTCSALFVLALCGVTVMGSSASAVSLSEMKKTLPAFSRVEFDLSGDLEIRPATDWRAEIKAEQKVIDAVMFKVERDTLKIAATKSYQTQMSVKIIVHMPALSALVSDASGDVVIGAVNCKSLKLVASGSGSIRVPALNCSDIEAEISGSGDLSIAGKANSFTVNASGSGTCDAQELAAGDVRVTQDGAGDVLVHAIRSLKATLDGSGDLKYRGNVAPKVTVSGAGSVVKIR
jgi:Putative auto-transporter adhesin, head GIN domain